MNYRVQEGLTMMEPHLYRGIRVRIENRASRIWNMETAKLETRRANLRLARADCRQHVTCKWMRKFTSNITKHMAPDHIYEASPAKPPTPTSTRTDATTTHSQDPGEEPLESVRLV